MVVGAYPTASVVTAQLNGRDMGTVAGAQKKTAQNLDMQLERRTAVSKLWIKGHRPGDILIRLQGDFPYLTRGILQGDITAIRKELHTEFKAATEEQVASSVGRYTFLVNELFKTLDNITSPVEIVRITSELRQLQTRIDKVQGLETRSLKIEHEVREYKTYTFRDEFPSIEDTPQLSESKVIDVEGKALEPVYYAST